MTALHRPHEEQLMLKVDVGLNVSNIHVMHSACDLYFLEGAFRKHVEAGGQSTKPDHMDMSVRESPEEMF